MDPALTLVYRQIIDDVIKKTKDNILLGMDQITVDHTVQRLLTVLSSLSFVF
jgi:hypothetical protein